MMAVGEDKKEALLKQTSKHEARAWHDQNVKPRGDDVCKEKGHFFRSVCINVLLFWKFNLHLVSPSV
jgi:hypothetical protein